MNHDAIVDLFTSVRKYPGILGIRTDFFACPTVKSAPTTVKAISEIMGIDGNHPGYVETVLETVSPHLVKSIMPGKVKPYTIEEWPDVIDDALGILHDNHWITVASMMTGLPKETEKDVIESIEFIDRINHHNVFVWVFPLICHSGRCARTRPNGHPSTRRCARSCDTERHENLCRHDRKAVV